MTHPNTRRTPHASRRTPLYLPAMRTALFLLLLAPAGAMAQEASPYVPISYWGTPYVEHLIARGRMVDPTPLTRPFRADVLLRALDAVDSHSGHGAEWRGGGGARRRPAPPFRR